MEFTQEQAGAFVGRHLLRAGLVGAPAIGALLLFYPDQLPGWLATVLLVVAAGAVCYATAMLFVAFFRERRGKRARMPPSAATEPDLRGAPLLSRRHYSIGRLVVVTHTILWLASWTAVLVLPGWWRWIALGVSFGLTLIPTSLRDIREALLTGYGRYRRRWQEHNA